MIQRKAMASLTDDWLSHASDGTLHIRASEDVGSIKRIDGMFNSLKEVNGGIYIANNGTYSQRVDVSSRKNTITEC